MSWNERGELIVEQKVVPNTNLNYLMYTLFGRNKKYVPQGLDTLLMKLGKQNTPSSLIYNENHKENYGLYKEVKPHSVQRQQEEFKPMKWDRY